MCDGAEFDATVILVGVPAVATLAGWLLAGREPTALARPAFE
jgi:hypothetical protein